MSDVHTLSRQGRSPTAARDTGPSSATSRPSDKTGRPEGPSPIQVLAGRVTMTVDEVADLLDISRGTAYEAVRRGDIPSLRLGRRIVIPVPQIRRMLGLPGTEEGPVTSSEPDQALDSPFAPLGKNTANQQ